jgi:WS/DGAT/MGAT family acyltransferase
MYTPVAPADAVWLRMDEATNPMVVTGVIVFDAPVPVRRLRRLLETRLVGFPRFTARVVEPPGGVGVPFWAPDEHFALEHHLVTARLPAPADEAALQTFVGRLMTQPFDRTRPLWQFHVIPRFQGGTALVGRVHHCIADGLALIYVMLSIADDGPVPPEPVIDETERAERAFWASVAAAMGETTAAVMQLPIQALREAGALLERPHGLAGLTGSVSAGAGALGRLLLLPPDQPTPLKGPLGLEKRVAWSPALDLDDFKRIGRLTGSTVNDILMAALGGALRRYLLERGPVDAALEVRAVIPVNLRAPEAAHQLGNEFGLVFVGLPLGLVEPLDRLFETRRRMSAIKDTPEAPVTFQVLRALGLAPRQVLDPIVDAFGAKATAVVTNVVGPPAPVAMAGVGMRQCMFWVPSAGRLGLGVSLLSYAGRVYVGVQSDAGIVPDPGRIVQGFVAEFAALRALQHEVGGDPPAVA